MMAEAWACKLVEVRRRLGGREDSFSLSFPWLCFEVLEQSGVELADRLTLVFGVDRLVIR